MGRRKLLFIANEDWFFWGHALSVARSARDLGYQVYVLAKVNQDTQKFEREGFKLLPWNIRRRSLNPIAEFNALRQVLRTCKDLRPDLIHGLSLKQVVYAGVAGQLLGIPTLNSITGLGHVFAADSVGMRVLKNVLLGLVKLSQRSKSSLLTVENLDDLKLLFDSKAVRRDKVVLVRGAGVDTEHYTPQPEPQGIPVVALASRLLWYKGVGEFVSAAQMLRNRGVQARFVLIGDNDPQNPSSVSTQQLKKWQDAGTVELWGRFTDMRAAFAQAHIICLPTYYREGIPKVLLEAAAAGRPIVTTDAPGCRDIVHHNENGLLVPIRDSVALANAVETLIKDPELRHALGMRGRERAVSEFRVELIVDKTLSLYQFLIKDSQGEPDLLGPPVPSISSD